MLLPTCDTKLKMPLVRINNLHVHSPAMGFVLQMPIVHPECSFCRERTPEVERLSMFLLIELRTPLSPPPLLKGRGDVVNGQNDDGGGDNGESGG